MLKHLLSRASQNHTDPEILNALAKELQRHGFPHWEFNPNDYRMEVLIEGTWAPDYLFAHTSGWEWKTIPGFFPDPGEPPPNLILIEKKSGRRVLRVCGEAAVKKFLGEIS